MLLLESGAASISRMVADCRRMHQQADGSSSSRKQRTRRVSSVNGCRRSTSAYAIYVAVFAFLCGLQAVGGLYSASDKVQLLNQNNFEKWVFKSKTAWIVEFYSSWCGFCKGFAPTWKKLGEEIHAWRGTVRLGGVDCADDTNIDICRRYVPVGYPTVRLFPPGLTSSTFEGEQIEAVVRETIPTLTQRIADFMEEVKVKYDMEAFPDLTLNKEDKLPPVSANELARVIIFENADKPAEGAVDNRFLLLEASLYKGVRGFRLGPNHPLRKELGIEAVPATVILDSRLAPVVKHENKILPKDQLHAALAQVLGDKKVVEPFEYNAGMPKEEDTVVKVEEIGNRPEYPPLLPVHMTDLENAIAYALRHEVVLRREISGEARDALFRFVNMLIKYFPGDKHVVDSLEIVRDYLDQRQTLKGEEFEAKLKEMDSGSKPTVPKVGPYTTCQGSKKKYRGFPCSMWTLFHVLSVEALRKGDQQAYRDVPQGIYAFIKNFFSCKYCARHFVEMTTETWEEFHDLAEMVLWLWRNHNKVNKRLAKDVSEDPMHPKVQFPHRAHCGNCFDYENQDWKLANVFEFLQRRYGSENIVRHEHPAEAVGASVGQGVGPAPPPQPPQEVPQRPEPHDVGIAVPKQKQHSKMESSDAKLQPALPKDDFSESDHMHGHYGHDHHKSSDFTFTSLMHLGTAAILVIFYCVITNRRRAKRRLSSFLPLYWNAAKRVPV